MTTDRLAPEQRARLIRETTWSHRGVTLFVLGAACLPFVLLGAKSTLDLLRGHVDVQLFGLACAGLAIAPVLTAPFGAAWWLVRRRVTNLLDAATARRATVTRIRRQGQHGLKIIDVALDEEERRVGWFSVTGEPGLAVGSQVDLLVAPTDPIRFVALTRLRGAIGHFGTHRG